jgi:hypothetical protein
MTAINLEDVNTAAFDRPPWMAVEQWHDVSADLTEQWLRLLEDAARRTVHTTAVEVIELPAGTPRRARCTCGWASPLVPSTPQATALGAEHERSARQPSLCPCGKPAAPRERARGQRRLGLPSSGALNLSDVPRTIARVGPGR